MGPERVLLQRSRATRPAQCFPAYPARTFLTRNRRNSRKRRGSSSRSLISRRTTSIRSSKRRPSPKPRATCRELRRSWLPSSQAADNPNALETQVYQAILERRPASIISRLKEILASPIRRWVISNGELRFWLGWAQEIAGDHVAAHESWRQARSELESFFKEQPENHILLGDLALTDVGLGDKAAAFALAEQAMAANPVEEDAVSGPCSDRDRRPRGRASGRSRSRHRRFAKVIIDILCGAAWSGGADHSGIASARSDVRSAPE